MCTGRVRVRVRVRVKVRNLGLVTQVRVGMVSVGMVLVGIVRVGMVTCTQQRPGCPVGKGEIRPLTES